MIVRQKTVEVKFDTTDEKERGREQRDRNKRRQSFPQKEALLDIQNPHNIGFSNNNNRHKQVLLT